MGGEEQDTRSKETMCKDGRIVLQLKGEEKKANRKMKLKCEAH